MKGAKPDYWPDVDGTVPGPGEGGEDGLKIGVTIVILAVAAIFVALLGLVLRQKLRKGESSKVGQNATKDQSEALQLDVDGAVLQEAISSMNSNEIEAIDTPQTNRTRSSSGGQSFL